MRVSNMSTAYGHIKKYSQSPFSLECEVCQQVYPSLSVRTHLKTKKHHLKTKKHQKNAIEFTKQVMLKKAAHQSISQTSKSSLREKLSNLESECQ